MLQKLLAFLIGIVLGFFLMALAFMYGREEVKKLTVDYPEEMSVATQGDYLMVEENTKDTVKLGFVIKPDYILDLYNQDSVRVFGEGGSHRIHIDSLVSYIEKDNL